MRSHNIIRLCLRIFGMSPTCPNGLSRRSFLRLSKRFDRNRMRRMLRVSGPLSSLSPEQMQRGKPTHELDKVEWRRRSLIRLLVSQTHPGLKRPRTARQRLRTHQVGLCTPGTREPSPFAKMVSSQYYTEKPPTVSGASRDGSHPCFLKETGES